MKNQVFSHNITNYLVAAYQGKFTFLNVLNLLGLLRQPEELQRCKTTVAKVALWNSKLWKGEELFNHNWSEPATSDAKHALKLLEELKPELWEMATTIRRILQLTDLTSRTDERSYLIACFARFAYGRENYLKGILEFAKFFNLAQAISVHTPLIPQAEAEVQLANNLVETAKTPGPAPEEFANFLRIRCISLPGIFLSHAHDINQLLAPFRGGFSYDTADFNHEEVRNWLNAGFEVRPAGYWRAFEFSPQDALAWIRVGVIDATTAFDWRLHGFSAALAAPWIQVNFPPPFARMWLTAGHDAANAKAALDAGITDPTKAPGYNPPNE